jgi:pyridoxine 5-phosphate synthase
MVAMIALGVNIDHVATLRNARGEAYPRPVEAARLAEAHGADGITIHLREDRRHIREADLTEIHAAIQTRLNLEMALTPEMLAIAVAARPGMVTLVPERREEVTTEGGLDVAKAQENITAGVAQLTAAGIAVSLFVDPDPAQIEASAQTGAPFIELHTGEYCRAFQQGPAAATAELKMLIGAANYAHELGLKVNAGHGLNLENIGPILQVPHLVELNIGHSIISRAVFVGLGQAVAEMKAALRAG